MIVPLLRLATRVWHDRRAVAGIEFAIIGPVVVALLLGCVTLFALFRGSQDAEKATFTVADIVSRQTSVSTAFLDTQHALFQRMLSDGSTDKGFRISSIRRVGTGFTVAWSYAVAPLNPLQAADIPLAQLPLVADGDSLVLVETRVPFAPIFAVAGMSGGEHRNLAANRPRFTASIAKSD